LDRTGHADSIQALLLPRASSDYERSYILLGESPGLGQVRIEERGGVMRRRLWSRVARIVITGLGLAALPMAIAVPAHAVDACTTRTLSRPFTGWGDSNDYFPVTSGTFESSTTGWSIGSGVSRVAENEPWRVAGSGSYSVRIPGGVSASTPVMCLTSAEDSTRFFYKSPGGGANLLVSIKATNTITNSVAVLAFTITTGTLTGWQVSPRISLPDVRGVQGFENVQITLTPQGSAAWQIDDVFVDPSRTL
jgi:hypothetical protein